MTNEIDLETRLELLEIGIEAIRKEIVRLEKDMEDFADKYGITK